MLGLVLLVEALAFGFDGEGVYELHILVIDRDFHLSPGDFYVGGTTEFFCLKIYDFGVEGIVICKGAV